MKELSYAEAYTNFLEFYSQKENIQIDKLVEKFKHNSVEAQFKTLYEAKPMRSITEYYKKLQKEL